jgi:hypothetical protein
MLEFGGSPAVVRRGALSQAISKPISGSCTCAGGNASRSGQRPGLAMEVSVPLRLSGRCEAIVARIVVGRATPVARPAPVARLARPLSALATCTTGSSMKALALWVAPFPPAALERIQSARRSRFPGRHRRHIPPTMEAGSIARGFTAFNRGDVRTGAGRAPRSRRLPATYSPSSVRHYFAVLEKSSWHQLK